MSTRTLFVLILALALMPVLAHAEEADPPAEAGEHAAEEAEAPAERALVILTSASVETQAMAMILSNAMAQQGTQLHILLCDQAGHLGIAGYESPQAVATPPANPAGEIRPEALLGRLMAGGATVEVCAIFLPNSQHGAGDLREGVGIAAPGPIATMMRDAAIRTFSF